MAKKKPTKTDYFHIRLTKNAKQKIAREARATKKTLTQVFEQMVDDRYSKLDGEFSVIQNYRNSSQAMQVALADQIERTTKLVCAISMIQKYAENHRTTHKDFAHFIIKACEDSLRCQ